MESSGCWFNKLPKHMWELLIFSRLSVRDLVWSARVCRLWRSLACDTLGRFHRLPWLMISRDKHTHIGTFLCLSDAKIYCLKLTPSACESYCCGGSSKGYLIMANRNGNFLFDPFSKISIDLPKQYVPREDMVYSASVLRDFRYYFTKAILSSSMADTSQFTVAALCSAPHIVEMCRPHHTEWSVTNAIKEEAKDYIPVEIDLFSDEPIIQRSYRKEYMKDELFLDILFYKGILYGLTRNCKLVSFDIQDSEPSLAQRVLNVLPMNMPKDTSGVNSTVYLVESCGELLMVYRYYNLSISDDERTNKYVTKKFVVYKLDQSSVPFQWVKIQSLGDHQMLFLGKNASMSVSAKGIPRFKGNCIYFSDDYWLTFRWSVDARHLCSDNGVFYLEDGRIESFFPTDDDSSWFKSHPIWVTPNIILRALKSS